jgi:smad nuclear-interacting protein 1
VSGKLYEAAMTNANGVVCKYAEPQDAAQPDRKWRIYVFKQGIEGIQDTLHISKQSKFSIGRDPKVQFSYSDCYVTLCC